MNKVNKNKINKEEQIKFYYKSKKLWNQLKDFVNSELFEEFEKYLQKELSNANSINDIDIEKIDEEELKTKIIYKKAKVEVYKKIIKFINSISNMGKYSEEILKRLEKEKANGR